MKGKLWKKVIFGICVISVMAFSFWYGGNAPGLQGFSVIDTESQNEQLVQANEDISGDASENQESSIEQDLAKQQSGKGESTEEQQETTEEKNIFQQIVMNIKLKSSAKNNSNKTQNSKKAQKNASKAVEKEQKKNGKKSTTEKKTTKKSTSEESIKEFQKQEVKNTDSDRENENREETIEGTVQCTVYISCATVLDNMDRLKSSKKNFIPKNGEILKETTVRVKEGSTIFEVLQKATKENKIHLEYTFTPLYKSYYIEGIHNLYEFDCGNTSGWMYSVNGEFPDEGCSFYEVKDGDAIRWLYSCDMGKDIGKYYAE